MIEVAEFEEIVIAYKEYCARLEKLEDLGIDLYDGPITAISDLLFDKWVDKVAIGEGQDLVYWWIFDDVEKKMYDSEGNVTDDVKDIKDFYKYLKDNNYLNDKY